MTRRPAAQRRNETPGVHIDSGRQWSRLLAGLFAVFVLFQWTATGLGSDRGQAGLTVGVLVVASTLGIERWCFGTSIASVACVLGLGRPRARGLLASGTMSLLLLLTIPLFAKSTGASLGLYPGWLSLLPGLFAQAGVAEEVLFRGYLFGHLRRGRSFWRAAALSMLPFVAVHLLLFATLEWPVAIAALLLAVIVSFPLAHLFELGGTTIWPPALLHFVIQGAVKVVVVSSGGTVPFPFFWMAATAVLPMLAFLIPPTPRERSHDGER